MAIKKPNPMMASAMGIMDQLPQLLLQMKAWNEQNELDRYRMETAEQNSLAELALSNINFDMQLNKESILAQSTRVDSINEDLQNVSSYLPNLPELQQGSSGNAQQVLTDLSASYAGPLLDGITERVNMATNMEETAYRLDQIVNFKERSLEVARTLKGIQAQYAYQIAGQGGDMLMVDEEDLGLYWDKEILPMLKERKLLPAGFEDHYEAEYKQMWMGMIAPESTRIAQREDIKKYRTYKVNQLINETSIMDIDTKYWGSLDKTTKTNVIKRVTNELNTVITPVVSSLNNGAVGRLITLNKNVSDLKFADEEYQKYPDDKSKWSKNTRDQQNKLDDQMLALGIQIIGQNRYDDMAYKDEAKNPSIHKDALDQKLRIIAKMGMDGVLAAIDKTTPSEKPLMDFIDVVDNVLKYELVADGSGFRVEQSLPRNFIIENPVSKAKYLDPEINRTLMLLGFDYSEFEQDLLRKLVNLNNFRIDKSIEPIFDAFDNNKSGKQEIKVNPGGGEPIIKDIGYNIPGNKFRDQQFNDQVDMAIGQIISDIENDWVI